MKSLRPIVPFLLGFALLFLGACGNTGSTVTTPSSTSASATPSSTSAFSGSSILLGKTSAQPSTLNVKVGDSVFVSDPATQGSPQTLYMGQNGAFQQQNGAPAELNSADGVAFDTGSAHNFTFTQAGTYTITSKETPSLNITITVQ